MHHAKVLSAAVLWLLAILFMIDATLDAAPMLLGWSILVGLGASMPSLWLIFDYNRNRLRDEFVAALRAERGRTEALVQAVACEFARAEVTDLDSRRSV